MPLNSPVDYSRYAFKSSWDNELLGKALLYKQEKYDKNREELQNFYNNISGIDLAKAEDREYFDERLKKLKKEVQLAGMGDLSRPGVKEHIESFIGQAADDKVVNGYYGTITGQRIKQQAYQTQQKNPEKYSDLNLAYSLRDYNAWVNDGQVGSTYRGGSTYIPYTDVITKANDAIKDIVPNSYVNLSKTGEISYFKVTGEEITAPEIKARLDATIMKDPNVAQQMSINAWGQYRHLDDAAFASAVKQSFNSQIKSYRSELQKINNKLFTAKPTERENLIATKTYLENQINTFNDNVKISDKDIISKRPQLELEFYKSDFLNEISNSYAYNKVKDKDFIYDEGDFQLKKFRADENYRNKKLALDSQGNYGKAFGEWYKIISDSGDINAAKQLAQNYGVPDAIIDSWRTGSSTTTPTSTEITPQMKSDIVNIDIPTKLTALENQYKSKAENFVNTLYDGNSAIEVMQDIDNRLPDLINEWDRKLNSQSGFYTTPEFEKQLRDKGTTLTAFLNDFKQLKQDYKNFNTISSIVKESNDKKGERLFREINENNGLVDLDNGHYLEVNSDGSYRIKQLGVRPVIVPRGDGLPGTKREQPTVFSGNNIYDFVSGKEGIEYLTKKLTSPDYTTISSDVYDKYIADDVVSSISVKGSSASPVNNALITNALTQAVTLDGGSGLVVSANVNELLKNASGGTKGFSLRNLEAKVNSTGQIRITGQGFKDNKPIEEPIDVSLNVFALNPNSEARKYFEPIAVNLMRKAALPAEERDIFNHLEPGQSATPDKDLLHADRDATNKGRTVYFENTFTKKQYGGNVVQPKAVLWYENWQNPEILDKQMLVTLARGLGARENFDKDDLETAVLLEDYLKVFLSNDDNLNDLFNHQQVK